MSSNVAPVARASGSSTIGHQLAHRGAGDHADAAALPALELVGAGLDLALEPAHAADAVLDLIEPVVDLRRRQLDAGPHVQLVGPERPVDATLPPRDPRTRLHEARWPPGIPGGRLAHEVMLAELGEPDRHHRAAEDGGPELVELAQRLLEHRAIVHARRHHDLGVELDAMVGEVSELRQDLGRGGIPEQVAAHRGIGGVDRHVERREPELDDPLDVLRLEIGERGEVAVAEREPVVVVPDVQHVAQPVGQAVDEAEVATVGAATDAGRLERDAQWLTQRALDLVLDLLAVRLADLEEKLLFGREELPVEEVLELPAVHRQQLRPLGEPELLCDRFGLYRRHSYHPSRAFPGHWPRVEAGKIARNAGKFKAPNHFPASAASDFSTCPPARVTSQPSPKSASKAAPYASSLAGPMPGTCRRPWRSRGRAAASSARVRSWKMT